MYIENWRKNLAESILNKDVLIISRQQYEIERENNHKELASLKMYKVILIILLVVLAVVCVKDYIFYVLLREMILDASRK